jgi:hypothetical protein
MNHLGGHPQTPRPRRLAVYGLTAGLLGGGAAGLLLTGTTPASARVSDVTGPVTGPAKQARGDRARSALAPLVSNGTITRAQADAVIAALDAARPARGAGGKGGPGRPGFRNFAAAAQALDMTEADLRTALEGGKTLAGVAQEKGIAASTVVDAVVAQLKAHLDERVASGKNTQDEADQILAEARSRIEAFVNGAAPAGGPRFGKGSGGRGGRGPGGGGPDRPAPPAGSGSSSGTTTS